MKLVPAHPHGRRRRRIFTLVCGVVRDWGVARRRRRIITLNLAYLTNKFRNAETKIAHECATWAYLIVAV